MDLYILSLLLAPSGAPTHTQNHSQVLPHSIPWTSLQFSQMIQHFPIDSILPQKHFNQHNAANSTLLFGSDKLETVTRETGTIARASLPHARLSDVVQTSKIPSDMIWENR